MKPLFTRKTDDAMVCGVVYSTLARVTATNWTTLFGLWVFLFPAPTLAQSTGAGTLFLVRAKRCIEEPFERSQTGFRVAGLTGIVTALHGVVDCDLITVLSDKGPSFEKPLKVSRADVKNDAALLSSDEIEAARNAGIPLAAPLKWSDLTEVTVVGHPFGMALHTSTLKVRQPPVRPLSESVPYDVLGKLQERDSPGTDIQILSLEGHIVPGHSGAPVLDKQGRAVAIANGGLKGGAVGFCWAVPLNQIHWRSAYELRSDLNSLFVLPVQPIFAFDTGSSEESLRKAPSVRKLSSEQYFHLGKLLFADRLYDQATDAFRRSSAGNPVIAEAYYWEGRCWIARSRVKDRDGVLRILPGARYAFQQYLVLEPTGEFADEVRGWLEASKSSGQG